VGELCGVISAGSRQDSAENIFEYGFVKCGEIYDQICKHYVYVLKKGGHTCNYTLNFLFLCFNDLFNSQSSVVCRRGNRNRNHRHHYLFEYFPNWDCFS